jgi:hypothetical protein
VGTISRELCGEDRITGGRRRTVRQPL